MMDNKELFFLYLSKVYNLSVGEIKSIFSLDLLTSSPYYKLGLTRSIITYYQKKYRLKEKVIEEILWKHMEKLDEIYDIRVILLCSMDNHIFRVFYEPSDFFHGYIIKSKKFIKNMMKNNYFFVEYSADFSENFKVETNIPINILTDE